MAIPLTAARLKTIRAYVAQDGPATRTLSDDYALELLDALDAREGQTCGVCAHKFDGLNGIIWCGSDDTPVRETKPAFGCNQWTPEEPQP